MRFLALLISLYAPIAMGQGAGVGVFDFATKKAVGDAAEKTAGVIKKGNEMIGKARDVMKKIDEAQRGRWEGPAGVYKAWTGHRPEIEMEPSNLELIVGGSIELYKGGREMMERIDRAKKRAEIMDGKEIFRKAAQSQLFNEAVNTAFAGDEMAQKAIKQSAERIEAFDKYARKIDTIERPKDIMDHAAYIQAEVGKETARNNMLLATMIRMMALQEKRRAADRSKTARRLLGEQTIDTSAIDGTKGEDE